MFRLLQSLSQVLLKNLLVWSLPCFRLVKQTNGCPARMNFYTISPIKERIEIK